MAFTPHKIVISSVGLLGGSLGLALKHSGYTGTITGLSSPAACDTALQLGCIDEGDGYDALAAHVAQADLLILCAPVLAIIRTLELLGTLSCKPGLVITDVGSTKREVVEAAHRSLPPHVRFIGGHPMAGSEKHGPGASDPYLFQNAVYVLTPAESEPDDLERDLATFLERYLGCRTVFLDPLQHDRIASAVSHVPHLLAVALVETAARIESAIPGTLQLAAGGFRDVTRIASSPYAMWHDILTTNREVIGSQIDDYIDVLTELKQSLFAGGLEQSFEHARQVRNAIPAGAKGFISQLSEVLVVAKDQPGVIAELSATLARERINIKDIEVLKVREGEGGTIRLAFESPDTAQRAIDVLSQHGIRARERA